MSTEISNSAYGYIRSRLLSGRYAPGVRVSEFSVAKELGISRSPVREAISHLISEGLLQKLPGYGAYVKIPDRREIEELMVVRELMEEYVVTKAASWSDPNQIEELQKI
ncbi:MAG TPA: GntR family transcriptional regulator, partial [Phycisphaerae bacterium]|nr:GntR family transcriptional regulator [Phycisphaerae bacterium]